MSWVRTYEGLYFQKAASNAANKLYNQVSAFAGKHIKTEKKVVEEMKRMRRDCQLELHPAPLNASHDAIFTITMNNVSTLRTNIRHIAACPNILASDVVILQETRTFTAERHLFCFPEYEVIDCISAHNMTDTGQDTVPFNGSMMLCKDALHPMASCLRLHAIPPDGIEIIHAKFPLCHVISIYKRPSVNINLLTNFLIDMMAVAPLQESPPMVLIGDFNIDLLGTSERPAADAFVSFMEEQGFRQLITEATTINGSLIDHIWTNVVRCDARQYVAPHSDHSYITFRMT